VIDPTLNKEGDSLFKERFKKKFDEIEFDENEEFEPIMDHDDD